MKLTKELTDFSVVCRKKENYDHNMKQGFESISIFERYEEVLFESRQPL